MPLKTYKYYLCVKDCKTNAFINRWTRFTVYWAIEMGRQSGFLCLCLFSLLENVNSRYFIEYLKYHKHCANRWASTTHYFVKVFITFIFQQKEKDSQSVLKYYICCLSLVSLEFSLRLSSINKHVMKWASRICQRGHQNVAQN